MRRLLVLTAAELTRDPRARRTAEAAFGQGLEVVGACVSDGRRAELPAAAEIRRVRRRASATRRVAAAARERAALRELRGAYRLGRLGAATLALAHAAAPLGPVGIVHAHDLDTLPAGALLARRHRARLVYDAHELYTRFERSPPRLYAWAVRIVEGTLARRADAVVTVSGPIARSLRDLHGLAGEPLVVLNCPPLGPSPPPRRDGGAVRVVYQAAVGPGRVTADLLAAAERAAGARVDLRIVGADPAALRRDVERRGLSGRVRVLEPVPPDRLVESLAGYDVGVVIDRGDTENARLALPNKLFEYLMAGLAVAVPRLPAMAELVEREGVGLTYEPGSPADLARALEELAADRPRLAEMQRRARAAAEERYNAEAQVPALLAAWGL
jgi:glycosyltransferase involved in cell wall biosynthesis